MKIRIKDSTVRFRLSMDDINRLLKKGKVEGGCQFGSSQLFKYSVCAKDKLNTEVLCIDLLENHIKVELSLQDVEEWANTDLIGFDAEMDNGSEEPLYVLLEKDFKCLVERDEDESSLYENPAAPKKPKKSKTKKTKKKKSKSKKNTKNKSKAKSDSKKKNNKKNKSSKKKKSSKSKK